MQQKTENRTCPFTREICALTCMFRIVPNSSAGLPCSLAEALRVTLAKGESAEPLLVRVMDNRNR